MNEGTWEKACDALERVGVAASAVADSPESFNRLMEKYKVEDAKDYLGHIMDLSSRWEQRPWALSRVFERLPELVRYSQGIYAESLEADEVTEEVTEIARTISRHKSDARQEIDHQYHLRFHENERLARFRWWVSPNRPTSGDEPRHVVSRALLRKSPRESRRGRRGVRSDRRRRAQP